MKKLWFACLIIAITLGCGGYKGKTNPMSPEEIQLADMAQKLESQAAELRDESDAAHEEVLTELADRAARFHNACRRFGSNSLEARNAFEKLYYQTSQVSANLTAETNSALFAKWQKMKTESIMEIAKILGYRPEEESKE